MTLVNLPSAAVALADTPVSQTASVVTPSTPPVSPTAQALANYSKLSGTERFDFIKAVYDCPGNAITARVMGAQWSSLAHRLSSNVGQVSRTDRVGVIKDILTNQDTRFSRAYGELDSNTRLAFWHRLVRSLNPYRHTQGFPSAAVQALVAQTERLNEDQQFAFLTQLVNQMGV